MGSHAKPRTTGRKTALSALAFGATLTGIGLTAAALDPATAVLTASGADGDGTTQLSGLSTPVSLDLGPAADSITDLTAAPLQPGSTVNAAKASAGSGSASGYASSAAGTLDSVGSVRRTTTSGSSGSSSGTSTGGGTGSPGTTASTGSGSGSPGSGSGSSSGGGIGSGTPPTDLSGITSAIQSTVGSTVAATTAQVLPTVDKLVSKVPVVSSLLQSTGDGQSTATAPGLSTLTGLL